ncbi:uncharacterized protein [Coffea arabica]|uniref:Reverse transcriptase zinc-binding domain-containing protein n=1 Tax=Coffea arabica TaxID=13443 RepID=A0ABM4VUM7_COFAR
MAFFGIVMFWSSVYTGVHGKICVIRSRKGELVSDRLKIWCRLFLANYGGASADMSQPGLLICMLSTSKTPTHRWWYAEDSLAHLLNVTNPPNQLVSDFLTPDGWNQGLLQQSVPSHIMAMIMQMRYYSYCEDSMVWLPSTSGAFSISLAWEVVRQRRNVSVIDSLTWSPLMPLKVSFFIGRARHGFLPTDSTLQRKGMILPSKCVGCKASQESVDHLLVQCTTARAVWSHYARMFGYAMDRELSLSSMLFLWVLNIPTGVKEHIRLVVSFLICWYIWRSRNEAKFQGASMAVQSIIFQTDAQLDLMVAAGLFKNEHFRGDQEYTCARGGRKRKLQIGLVLLAWEAPPVGAYKLNSDASVLNGQAFGGGLV